jgi:hypothetical protein
MKINTTLFELDVVYTTIPLAKTMEMAETFSIAIEQMEDMKMQINYKTIKEGVSYDSYIKDIDSQLFYCRHNYKILIDSLLIHESKVLEKRLSLGDLQTICLN